MPTGSKSNWLLPEMRPSRSAKSEFTSRTSPPPARTNRCEETRDCRQRRLAKAGGERRHRPHPGPGPHPQQYPEPEQRQRPAGTGAAVRPATGVGGNQIGGAARQPKPIAAHTDYARIGSQFSYGENGFLKLALFGYGNVGRAFARLLASQRSVFPFRIVGIQTLRHGTAFDHRGLPLAP